MCIRDSYIPIDFSKCPNAFASKEAFTTPFPPGAIGSLVQSATAQAQEVVTLVSTHGWFPVLVMVYSTVTGRFNSICPKLSVSLFEEIRGWATAVKATDLSPSLHGSIPKPLQQEMNLIIP